MKTTRPLRSPHLDGVDRVVAVGQFLARNVRDCIDRLEAGQVIALHFETDVIPHKALTVRTSKKNLAIDDRFP